MELSVSAQCPCAFLCLSLFSVVFCLIYVRFFPWVIRENQIVDNGACATSAIYDENLLNHYCYSPADENIYEEICSVRKEVCFPIS